MGVQMNLTRWLWSPRHGPRVVWDSRTPLQPLSPRPASPLQYLAAKRTRTPDRCAFRWSRAKTHSTSGSKVYGRMNVCQHVFLGSHRANGRGNHLARGHLEVGNQRLGALPGALKLPALGSSGSHGPRGPCELQSLAAGLLVRTGGVHASGSSGSPFSQRRRQARNCSQCVPRRRTTGVLLPLLTAI